MALEAFFERYASVLRDTFFVKDLLVTDDDGTSESIPIELAIAKMQYLDRSGNPRTLLKAVYKLDDVAGSEEGLAQDALKSITFNLGRQKAGPDSAVSIIDGTITLFSHPGVYETSKVLLGMLEEDPQGNIILSHMNPSDWEMRYASRRVQVSYDTRVVL